MPSHKIAVISDTHGLLRPEIRKVLKDCEIILHGGDIDKQEVLEELNRIAPTYVVRGNADKEWAKKIPNELETELYGFRIYMVHNKKHMREDLSEIDIVIYGHSHKYEEKYENNTFYLNPGSCGPRRFHLPITMAVLTVYGEEHQFEVKKVDCSPVLTSQNAMEINLNTKDISKLISEIMKEIDAGKSVKTIAERNRVAEPLVEQICRIYVTHPGVDVQGIMDRMEILGKNKM